MMQTSALTRVSRHLHDRAQRQYSAAKFRAIMLRKYRECGAMPEVTAAAAELRLTWLEPQNVGTDGEHADILRHSGSRFMHNIGRFCIKVSENAAKYRPSLHKTSKGDR